MKYYINYIDYPLEFDEFFNVPEFIKHRKNMDKISISFLQRIYNLSFPRAKKVFTYLLEKGFIDEKGNINNKKFYEVLGEELPKPNNFIFLSIDGVLNDKDTKELIGDSKGIDEEKVAILKEIVDATNSKIILIDEKYSDGFYFDEKLKDKQSDIANNLEEKLGKYGINIFDKALTISRGEAIDIQKRLVRFKGFEVDKFVILDTELRDYKDFKLFNHLVQTSYNNGGLQRKHINNVLKIFK